MSWLDLVLRYDTSLDAINALVLLLLGSLLWALSREVLADATWAKWLGLAFVVLGAKYCVDVGAELIRRHGLEEYATFRAESVVDLRLGAQCTPNAVQQPSPPRVCPPVVQAAVHGLPLIDPTARKQADFWFATQGIEESVTVVLSAVNTGMLAAAGLRLLGVLAPLLAWLSLLGTLIAGLGLVFTMGDLSGPWSLPDAIYSAAALIVLGAALWRSVGGESRGWVAWASLGACIGYSVLLLSDPLAPLAGFGNSSSFRPMLAAFSLPLKVILGGAALLLIFRDLVPFSTLPARKVLERISKERAQTFLTSSGVVRAVAETFQADLAEVLVWHPSVPPTSAEVERYSWLRARPEEDIETFVKQQDCVDHPAWESLEEGKPIFRSTSRLVSEGFGWLTRILPFRSSYRQATDGVPWPPDVWRPKGTLGTVPPACATFASTPVLHRGSVVGVIGLWWQRRRALSVTLRNRLSRVALDLGPLLQQHREEVAVDHCSKAMHEAGARCDGGGPRQRAAELSTRVLREAFGQIQVGIYIEAGFHAPWWHTHPRIPNEALLDGCPLERLRDDWTRQLRAEEPGREPASVLHLVELPLLWGSSEIPIGSMVLGVDTKKPCPDRTITWPNRWSRQTVSSLVVDAVHDAIIHETGAVLQRVVHVLHEGVPLFGGSWIDALSRELRPCGILWVISDRGGPVGCDDEGVAQWLSERAAMENGHWAEGVRSHPLRTPLDGAGTIVELPIPEMRERLWLGVERDGFGPELEAETPWRVFLDRVAATVSTFRLRVHAAVEVESENAKRRQQQAIVTAAALTAQVTHKIGNFAREIRDGAELLNRMQQDESLNLDATPRAVISSMYGSAIALGDTVRALLSVESFRDEGPTRVAAIVKQVEATHANEMALRSVKMIVEVAGDLVTTLPPAALFFALDNLITNAVTAFAGREGTIRLTARACGQRVECDIADDGPGVPKHLESRLFDIGASTKESGGWGLALVCQALTGRGAGVTLLRTSPEGTVFRLDLPAQVQASMAYPVTDTPSVGGIS